MTDTSIPDGGIVCPIAVRAKLSPGKVFYVDGVQSHTYSDFHQLVTAYTYRIQQDSEAAKVAVLTAEQTVWSLAKLWAAFRCGCLVLLKDPAKHVPDWANRDLATGRMVNLDRDLGDVEDFPIADGHDLPVFSAKVPATGIATSGSTGEAKWVIHALSQHYYSAIGSGMPLSDSCRYLWSLPYYHISGLAIVFRVVFSGGTLVARSHASLGTQMRHDEITHCSLVSPQFAGLLADVDAGKMSLNPEGILLGGSALQKSYLRRGLALNLPLYITYGLSEFASQVSCRRLAVADCDEAWLHFGHALPYRQIKRGVDGCICLKGKTGALGYWTKSGLQALPIDSDGYWVSSDLGRFDGEGHLSILGRADDVIISGGVNIYPEQLEAVLKDALSLDQVLVVGIPNDRYGQRPVVFAAPSVSLDRIRSVLGAKFPAYYLPEASLNWPADVCRTGIKPQRSVFKSLAISQLRQS